MVEQVNIPGGRRKPPVPPWAKKTGATFATVAATLLGLLFVTFMIGRVMPIDPVLAVIGERATQAQYDETFRELGLDRPLIVQFGIYVGNVLQGDFGTSIRTGQPVLQDIARVLPATIELATFAILIGAGLGTPLGVIAAVNKDRWPDQLIRVISLMGHSMPIFWTGMIALLVAGCQQPEHAKTADHTGIGGETAIEEDTGSDARSLHLSPGTTQAGWWEETREERRASHMTLYDFDRNLR